MSKTLTTADEYEVAAKMTRQATSGTTEWLIEGMQRLLARETPNADGKDGIRLRIARNELKARLKKMDEQRAEIAAILG